MPDDPRGGGFDLGSLIPLVGGIGALRGNTGFAAGWQQAEQEAQQQREAQQLADYRQGQLGLQEQGLGLQQQRIDLDRNNQAMQYIEAGRQMLGSITNTDQLREAHALLRSTSQQFGVDPEYWNQPVSQRTLAIPFEKKKGKYEEIVERFDPQQIQGMRESGAMVTVDGELVRFDQLERDVLGLGPGFEVPPLQGDQPSLQSKEMLLDGRPVPLNFNPQTGVYTVPGTDAPIDPSRIGLIPEPTPTFVAQTLDEAGNPVIRVLPRTSGVEVPRDTSSSERTTESQAQAGTFASRMEQAEQTFSELEEHISTMNPLLFEAQVRLDSPTLQTPEMQKFRQAARNFINALLRDESGAVIGVSEFIEGDRQYLPRPDDDAETLREKRINRQIVFDGLRRFAGSAYIPLDERLEAIGEGVGATGNGFPQTRPTPTRPR